MPLSCYARELGLVITESHYKGVLCTEIVSKYSVSSQDLAALQPKPSSLIKGLKPTLKVLTDDSSFSGQADQNQRGRGPVSAVEI